MNMQNLMREAQKMQKELEKSAKELENSEYEGTSSLVQIVLDGKKDIKSVKINIEDAIEKEDKELLEDMIFSAFSSACKKVDAAKEKKLGKYGNGLSGLM